MTFFRHITAPAGWFYSDTFNYWQRTNGRVVCYVSPIIGGFQAQLYLRGDLSMCELEVRTDKMTEQGYDRMFQIGNEWLSKYAEGHLSTMHEDLYSIKNPNGVWRKNPENKGYWI